MTRPVAVYVGIMLALFVVVVPAIVSAHHSLGDIGTPCRHHGGVRQFVPTQIGPFHYEPATVVCMDGKVGRV